MKKKLIKIHVKSFVAEMQEVAQNQIAGGAKTIPEDNSYDILCTKY